MYLLSVDSLGVVQLGIALLDSGFVFKMPNIFIVFSKLGEILRGRVL